MTTGKKTKEISIPRPAADGYTSFRTSNDSLPGVVSKISAVSQGELGFGTSYTIWDLFFIQEENKQTGVIVKS